VYIQYLKNITQRLNNNNNNNNNNDNNIVHRQTQAHDSTLTKCWTDRGLQELRCWTSLAGPCIIEGRVDGRTWEGTEISSMVGNTTGPGWSFPGSYRGIGGK